jgi:hypothetical protein
VFAEFKQCFGQVIDHEPVMVRKELNTHFRDFPPRYVKVNPVEKRQILPDAIL